MLGRRRPQRVEYRGYDILDLENETNDYSLYGGTVMDRTSPARELLPILTSGAFALSGGALGGHLLTRRHLPPAARAAVGLISAAALAGLTYPGARQIAHKSNPRRFEVTDIIGPANAQQVLDAKMVRDGEMTPKHFEYVHGVSIRDFHE